MTTNEDLPQDLTETEDELKEEKMSKASFIKKMREAGANEFDADLADDDTQHYEYFETHHEEKLLVELKRKVSSEISEEIMEKLGFWPLACLRGRKYDLDRAASTLQNLLKFIEKYEIFDNPPDADEAIIELGKKCVFRAFGNVDLLGRYIMHCDYGTVNFNEIDPKITIRSLYVNMKEMLEGYPRCQLTGVTFLADLTTFSMRNFDTKLEKEITKTFNDTFPIRMGYLLYMNSPWYLRAFMPIVKLFMKKKMRKRIHTVNTSNLSKFVSEQDIPIQFGGSFTIPADQLPSRAE